MRMFGRGQGEVLQRVDLPRTADTWIPPLAGDAEEAFLDSVITPSSTGPLQIDPAFIPDDHRAQHVDVQPHLAQFGEASLGNDVQR